MRQILLDCIEFDWENISPAIFGAMFQAVMDKTQRRELGAHYTSEENILKLINPLFMDELRAEFEKVKTKKKALEDFHNKLAKLKFLDPACGCGNFLIIAYRELRMLELEVIKILFGGKDQYVQSRLLDRELLSKDMLKVTIEQFYGIEIEKFPCQVAQVGMWLTDHQMNLRVRYEFGEYYPRLPLTQTAVIAEGNALRMDWESIIPKTDLSYILGNPPFIGYAFASAEQKADMAQIFPKNKTLDYVAAWYKKSADYMLNTTIRAAFVSTNSIAQGEQPTILWKPLKEQGIFINFGIPSFVWSNEARGKAQVHCVIVGFSYIKTEPNINHYLLEAPTVFIEKRAKPLSNVPEMTRGSDPVDGGNLIIEENEYEDFIIREPLAVKYIRQFMMGREFLNNKRRYCLWLVGASPADLRKMPLVLERIEKCRQMRIASSRANTLRAAETPSLFESNRQPDTDYIAIPKVSSERRLYIPIGYLDKDIIAGDKLFTIPNATLYHFGILTSAIHNSWMRVVAGRLKSDYSYSNTIVYNNFPWPQANDEQNAEIEKLAQAILDEREKQMKADPECSLATLYGNFLDTIYTDLRKAHRNLDDAVMKLYNFPKTYTEADIVAALMQLYQTLIHGGGA
jgi:hypothetical protein